MGGKAKVLVHIVTYNSVASVTKCVRSLLQLSDYTLGKDLFIEVTDNASSDRTVEILKQEFQHIKIFPNSENLGFCAAHNQAVQRFLNEPYDFLLFCNPDLALESAALSKMVAALEADRSIGMATPKLLRADHNLEPLRPNVLDACGMTFDHSLRHLDRGSGERDLGQFDKDEKVFGGSGAALLVSRACAEAILLQGKDHETDVDSIYPQLATKREERAPFFDEAFFAYREDAELAWRAARLGWETIYVSKAIGYHVRVVVPERRKQLPAQINAWSVRNRFLMQLVHLSCLKNWQAIVPGLLIRNLIVILGVLFTERSSLPSLLQVWQLRKRALSRRKRMKELIANSSKEARPIFIGMRSPLDYSYILALFLICLLFYPFPFASRADAIPAAFSDAWQNVWNIWRMQRWAAGLEPSLYQTNLLYHPFGTTLLMHALLEALLVPISIAIQALGIICTPEKCMSYIMLGLVLANFVSSRLFFKEILQHRILINLFALIFTFQPYFLYHIRAGHVNLLAFFPVMLLLTAFMRRLGKNLTKPFYLSTVVCFAFLAYFDLYTLYFGFFLLALLIIGALLGKRIKFSELIPEMLWFAFLFAIIAVPKLILMQELVAEGRFLGARNPYMRPGDLLRWFSPPSTLFFHNLIPSISAARPRGHGDYLGWSILLSLVILLIIGFKKSPHTKRWLLKSALVASILFFFWTAGPTFNLGTTRLMPNPIFMLSHTIIPGFPGMPDRFLILAVFALLVSLAILVDGIRSNNLPGHHRWQNYIAYACLLLIVIEWFPAPLRSSARPPSPAILRLAQNKEIVAVLDISRDRSLPPTRQRSHLKQITFGGLSREPLLEFRATADNPFYLALTGQSQLPATYNDFALLKVDAIVIDSTMPQSWRIAAAIPWLQPLDRDNNVRIFVARNEKRDQVN